MTAVSTHTRKIMCAGVRRMRGIGVVFAPPVAYKGIAVACMNNANCPPFRGEEGTHRCR